MVGLYLVYSMCFNILNINKLGISYVFGKIVVKVGNGVGLWRESMIFERFLEERMLNLFCSCFN